MKTKRTFPVVEIFASMQGEGANTGKEAVFLRLGGCNLACPWCDTDFSRTEELHVEEITRRIQACSPLRSLIVTGGEPLILPNIEDLLAHMKTLGYWIAVESNGVLRASPAARCSIDYLAVSPKALYAEQYRPETMADEADEVRVVVDGEVASFCVGMREKIRAGQYFLSPCEREGKMNLRETVRMLGMLNASNPSPPWLLSLQSHKLAGFR